MCEYVRIHAYSILGTDETDFGSILRPKCKEHPLLVCDVMEPKRT